MPLDERVRRDWPSVVVALAGVAVVIVPFLTASTTSGMKFVNILSGLFLVGVGCYDVVQRQVWGTRLARYWAMGALGAFLAVLPSVLGAEPAVRWVDAAAGAVALVAAAVQFARAGDGGPELPITGSGT